VKNCLVILKSLQTLQTLQVRIQFLTFRKIIPNLTQSIVSDIQITLHVKTVRSEVIIFYGGAHLQRYVMTRRLEEKRRRIDLG
jgi:hypothetical protein